MNERSLPYALDHDQARSYPGSFPVIKAAATDTGGLLTVTADVLRPRTAGPPLHVHDETDECFYVVEGEFLVQIGADTRELGTGSFAWLPRGIPHTFANASDRPARIVGIYVPAGIEEYFAAQSAYLSALQGPPDPARIAEIWSGHAGRIAGPPIQLAGAGPA